MLQWLKGLQRRTAHIQHTQYVYIYTHIDEPTLPKVGMGSNWTSQDPAHVSLAEMRTECCSAGDVDTTSIYLNTMEDMRNNITKAGRVANIQSAQPRTSAPENHQGKHRSKATSTKWTKTRTIRVCREFRTFKKQKQKCRTKTASELVLWRLQYTRPYMHCWPSWLFHQGT